MKVIKASCCVLGAVVLLSGCTTHKTRQIGKTDVNLDKHDYVMLKPAAMGASKGFKLLGLLPLKSPSYAQAKTRLYDSVGENLAGRSIALANYTSSESTIYLLLFSMPKVTVSADIVEFMEEEKVPVDPVVKVPEPEVAEEVEEQVAPVAPAATASEAEDILELVTGEEKAAPTADTPAEPVL